MWVDKKIYISFSPFFFIKESSNKVVDEFKKTYVAGFFDSRKTTGFKQGRGSTDLDFFLKFDFITVLFDMLIIFNILIYP
jgi:hypothetical protein